MVRTLASLLSFTYKIVFNTNSALMNVAKLYTKFMDNVINISPTGSAHATLYAWPPIDMKGNFPVHVSPKSPSNISPNPSELISKVSEN